MAIQLEYINLVVLIRKIKEKYPGGWNQCLKDHEGRIGNIIYKVLVVYSDLN